MPVFGEDDLPTLFGDLGVDVTLGATTVKGFVDREDRRLLEGDGSPAAMIGQEIVVTVPAGALPGLDVKSAIVVDGTSYVVSALLAVEDGATVSLLVRKP